ncbi:MAG: galactose oxidase-like domain-containing protein [Thermoanaerobaculia bacterium]
MDLRSQRRAAGLGVTAILTILPLAAASIGVPLETTGGQAGSSGSAATLGKWSAPFDLHVIGTHSTLLHGGAVLFFSYPTEREHGSDSWTWNSTTHGIAQVRSLLHRDVFCSGHSVLPDGRAFVTGGTMWGTHQYAGAHETSLFDPTTSSWSRGPSMAFARWYPSNLTLPNGDVLIVSGTDTNEQPVAAVERYSVATNTITSLPSSADKLVDEYPRLHVLPSGKVFMAGQEGDTFLLDPDAGQWTFVDTMNFGDRYSGASVLLPGLQKVLALGGNQIDPEAPTLGTNPPTETAEIIDLSQATPRWRYTSPMHYAREHANAVLLPDGTVLVVGGGQSGLYRKPVKQAELFDPESETWTLMATETTPRAYHSTAILLPDGRVLSAGMDSGKWRRTGEIYSPPYLFKGPRPSILSAPSSIGYGSTFAVQTPDSADVQKVVLLRAGSVTHSVNFEQRYVALTFSPGEGQLSAAAPAGGTIAPPGWYLLFLVSSTGVPSVSAWVHVG